MKCTTKRLPVDIKNPHLYILADWHFESPNCNVQLILDELAKIKEDPAAVVLIGGDLFENATRKSVGDPYTLRMPPEDALAEVVKLLRPIKDKIAAVTNGNHEARTYKECGFDLMTAVVQCLGLEDVYDPAGVMLFLHWGKSNKSGKVNTVPHCKTVYIQHGDGIGGTTIGGKMNGVQRREAMVPDADVIICCHVHTPATWKESYYVTDTRHDTVKMKERTYIVVGSALEYDGGYAEKYALRPSANVFPMAICYPNTVQVIM